MTRRRFTRRPTEAAVRLWTRLNRAQAHVMAEVERRLKAEGLPSLVVYDVLLELSRAPDERLRQVDLQQQLLFPQYTTSRLVERLRRDGWVAVQSCRQDQRVTWVALTPEGRALREMMWPVYGQAIADLIDDALSESEAALGARLLEALYRR